jgi:hypothetical protein
LQSNLQPERKRHDSVIRQLLQPENIMLGVQSLTHNHGHTYSVTQTIQRVICKIREDIQGGELDKRTENKKIYTMSSNLKLRDMNSK